MWLGKWGEKMENLNELEELVQPICEWIHKNGNPYTKVVIDLEGARVTEDVAGLPVKKK